MERLILRFHVNQSGKTPITAQHGLRGRTRGGVRAIATDLVINYADEKYQQLVGSIKSTIEKDIRGEIQEMARHYNAMVIGGSPGLSGPGKRTLRAKMSGGPTETNVGSRLPSWPGRGRKYLARKTQEVGHTKWFLGQTQYLRSQMKRGEIWTDIFGPVRVTVQRTRATDVGGVGSKKLRGLAKLNTGDFGNIRVGIAQIKVEAMGRIHPHMLRNYSSQGGLIGLVAARDPELAYRLGGRTPAKHRPSIQPFLEFVLTKAIPYAVQKRVSMGLGSKLSKNYVTGTPFGAFGTDNK